MPFMLPYCSSFYYIIVLEYHYIVHTTVVLTDGDWVCLILPHFACSLVLYLPKSTLCMSGSLGPGSVM